MKNWKDFADSLGVEAKTEMAESFFGKRRKAEDEEGILAAKATELKKHYDRALRRLGRLHALLLDQDAVLRFYRLIGLPDAPKLLNLTPPANAHLTSPLPWGLSFCHRYARLLLDIYSQAQDSVDEYLHGRWLPSPDTSGKKQLSVHYEQLAAWQRALSARIQELNEYQSPSQVLEFAKRMDPLTMEKERLLGGTLENYAQALDDGLKLNALELDSFGLTPLPDLPPPDQHSKQIKRFGRALCAAHPNQARQLIA